MATNLAPQIGLVIVKCTYVSGSLATYEDWEKALADENAHLIREYFPFSQKDFEIHTFQYSIEKVANTSFDKTKEGFYKWQPWTQNQKTLNNLKLVKIFSFIISWKGPVERKKIFLGLELMKFIVKPEDIVVKGFPLTNYELHDPNWKSLQEIHHSFELKNAKKKGADNGSVLSSLVPYFKEGKLYLLVKSIINPKKWNSFEHSFTLSNFSVKGLQSKIKVRLALNDQDKMENREYQITKGFTFGMSIDGNNAELEVGVNGEYRYEKSTSGKKVSMASLHSKNGLVVTFDQLTKSEEELTVDTNFVVIFDFAPSWKKEDIMLESTIIFRKHKTILCSSSKRAQSSQICNIVLPQVANVNATICIVMDYPSFDKFSISKQIGMNCTENRPVIDDQHSTPSQTKYYFSNLNLFKELPSATFEAVDCCGYFFDPNSEYDMNLLKAYVKGLVDGIEFSKKKKNNDNQPENLIFDANNSVTHVIIVVDGHQLLNPQANWIWWWNKYYTTPNENGIKALEKLYWSVVKALAKEHYGEESETAQWKARAKIGVLVTHVDQIPGDRAQVKKQLYKLLYKADVPRGYIAFGEKECTWDVEEIKQHDKQLKEFLVNVPEGENYCEYFEAYKKNNPKKNIPSKLQDLLHIDPNCCTKKGCTHQFTEESKQSFINFLGEILGSSVTQR